MSIQGIPSGYGPGLVPGLGRTRTGDEPAPKQIRQAEVPAPAAQPQRRDDSVPAEAPPGTDPALWKVLTTEERAFFARARAMGPLTYGPGTTRDGHVPAALQGGRIDVKV